MESPLEVKSASSPFDLIYTTLQPPNDPVKLLQLLLRSAFREVAILLLNPLLLSNVHACTQRLFFAAQDDIGDG
jgi:hypothetical protein